MGPNMHGTPRPLGIKGVKSIPASKYKMQDFARFIKTQETHINSGNGTHRAMVGTPTALVLFDQTGPWGWIGNLYSYQMANLLSYFGVNVTREGMQAYKAGDLAKYSSAYYIGTTYGEPLTSAFQTDFFNNNNPFVWCGYNLWQVAWTPDASAWNATFTYKYGFQFAYLDGNGYPTVNYKGTALTKQQYDPTQGDTMATVAGLSSVLATSTNASGGSAPYITKGANLYYVADNPMEYVAYNRGDDRMLAFDDILNDTTGITPTTAKRAVLRIEDVSPICDSKSLRAIADALYAQGVPYVVSVIPEYKDPMGHDNNGKPLDIPMQTKATFIADLKYMQSKGAQLIMHGITHQYSNLANPYDGESADDVEFFRVIQNSDGSITNVAPVNEDSTAWVTNRVNTGFSMFTAAGLAKPIGWNSPHYYGSPIDYTAFGQMFNFSMDRGLSFVNAADGTLEYVIGYAPWVIHDQYGVWRIPETMGYYDPTGSDGKINNPADMIGYAKAMQCVRGGWAGCYYHWYLGTTALNQLVTGIKNLGYTFTNPTATTR